MKFDDYIKKRINLYEQILDDRTFKDKFKEVYEKIRETLATGGKLLLCGNGGSAADCQHIAAEFIGKLSVKRESWPAIALTTDSAVLTAVGNDYVFSYIFARQIEALAQSGDMLIALSTSGNSENVLCAIQAAKDSNIAAYAITGASGGKIATLYNNVLQIPVHDPQICQELTVMIFHTMCAMLESECHEQVRFLRS